MNYVQHSVSFVNFSQLFAKYFTLPANGSPGEIFTGNRFFTHDVPLGILALTGLVLGIQKKEDLKSDLPVLLPDLLWF